MKTFPKEVIQLEKIVGGGQALGTLPDGRKVFVWGGLPSEKVEVQLTKSKSKMAEAVVTEIIEPSTERVEPKDPESYLSTSPWQIMSAEAEARYKTTLINDAFELHHVTLPSETKIYSDNNLYGYRNKVEFSWYGDESGLHLAFYRRGTHGKVIVDGTSLARGEINTLARQIRDALSTKGVEARQLKTLLIRCDQHGDAVWQLYVKDSNFDALSEIDMKTFTAQGGEVIYSDPKSPASRITKRLASFGSTVLSDEILGVPFRYATEGFFQVNIPVYERALQEMRAWTEVNDKRVTRKGATPTKTRSKRDEDGANFAAGPATSDLRSPVPHEARAYDGSGNGSKVIDFYSGVGTIGLTIGGDNVTLVEVNEDAVREMRANIKALHKNTKAVLAPSEKALEYITSDATIILDPPRAGLHDNVTERLLDVTPPRIIYLSCNPVTQARDVAKLLEKYEIVGHQGYNFFPRTPHIEHLVVLDKKLK